LILGTNSIAALTLNGSTQAATFSSTATATAFIPSGATVPTNGMYLSGANTLNFATNSTNRLTVTSGGNVGIGIDNPALPLHVQGPLLSGFVNMRAFDSASMAANVGGGLSFGGKYTSGGTYTDFAFIKGNKENGTSEDFAGYLNFYTRANAGSFSERMRITSGGNVLIGTTTDAGFKLDVNGTGRFSGSVTATSVNVVYNNTLTGQTADDVTLASYTAGSSNELLQITITLTNNNATGQVRATFSYTTDDNDAVTLGAIATTPQAANGEGQAVVALNIKNGTTLTIKSLITVGAINYNSRVAITKIL
jgi:hypothetical protein